MTGLCPEMKQPGNFESITKNNNIKKLMKIFIIFYFALQILGLTSCQIINDEANLYHDALVPVGLSDVKVEGELGRRINMTMQISASRRMIPEILKNIFMMQIVLLPLIFY